MLHALFRGRRSIWNGASTPYTSEAFSVSALLINSAKQDDGLAERVHSSQRVYDSLELTSVNKPEDSVLLQELERRIPPLATPTRRSLSDAISGGEKTSASSA